jgi:hypothetical protein
VNLIARMTPAFEVTLEGKFFSIGTEIGLGIISTECQLTNVLEMRLSCYEFLRHQKA